MHYTKPSGGVSPACRSLMSCNSPPFGGTPSLVLVGVVPTVQTTSANTSDNELLSARWSALRGQQCLSWRTARTRTPEHAREPLDTHVNPSTCTWAGPPTHISSGPRAGHRVHVRLQGPACRSSGPRAPSRTRVRMGRPMRGHVDPSAGSDAAGRELRSNGSWSWQLSPPTGSGTPFPAHLNPPGSCAPPTLHDVDQRTHDDA